MKRKKEKKNKMKRKIQVLREKMKQETMKKMFVVEFFPSSPQIIRI